MISFILSDNCISLMLKGKVYQIRKGHRNYDKIKSSLKTATVEQMLDLVSEEAKLKSLVGGDKTVTFKDGKVYVNGTIVSSKLTERYMNLIKDGMPASSYEAFIRNVFKNPSEESVVDLYAFLEKCSLPITDDGCFLAYKRINKNWKDCHTGRIDNSIGRVVKMKREDCDADRRVACSTGLHVCSLGYLGSFSGDRTIIVKVNPQHVVSVPVDHGCEKMRVCQYTVLEELKKDELIPDNHVNTSDEVEDDEVDPALVDMAPTPVGIESIVSKLNLADKNKVLEGINAVTVYCSKRNVPENFYEALPAIDRRNLYRCAERVALKGTGMKSSIREIREVKTTVSDLKLALAKYLARKCHSKK